MKDLNNKELMNVNGGGCGFAYDVGFAWRVIMHSTVPVIGASLVVMDVAVYDAYCN